MTRRTLLVLLILAAALRVAALTKPFYVDEITTLTVASQPLASMGEVMRKIDASPALYPTVLHFWLNVSHADVWPRLLSAVFGVALVWAVFGLGRAAFGDRAGLWAAFVVAIAPIHVEYAAYVRSYSLFTLLIVLQIWTFMRCLVPEMQDERQPTRALVWFTIVTATAFYTHYLSLLILVPEGLYALWRLRDAARRVFMIGGAVVIAAALFVPGVPLLRHNIEFDAKRQLDRPAAPAVTTVVPDLFGELSLGRRDLGFASGANPLRRASLTAGLVLFPALFLIGASAGWRRQRDATILLAACAILPILVYILSGRTLMATRFFLPFGAVFLVIVAHGLASLHPRLAASLAAVLALLCLIPIQHFVRHYNWSYDHRRVVSEMDSRWQPGDIILFVHPFETLHYQWYMGTGRPMMGLTFTPLTSEQTTYVIKPTPLDVETAKSRVLEAARTHERLWVVGQSERSFSSGDHAEERDLLAWMDGRFGQIDDLGAVTGGDPVVRLYRGRIP